ncbi:MAG: BatA domain-containing protein [Victivallaceae bacterium]
MFFANSLYLWGALLLAAPIILHFLRQKPSQPKKFPSLFFLEKYIAASTRKNNLLKYLLLSLRLLLLSALILKFAWPYIGNNKMETQEATIILIDDSMSTTSGAVNPFIQQKIQSSIAKATPENPIMLGIVADQINWSKDFYADPAILQAFCQKNLKGTTKSTFREALMAADLRLKRRKAKFRRLLIISDRQIRPWSDVDFKTKLSSCDAIQLIQPPLSEQMQNNLAINHAEIRELSLANAERATLSAVVANYGIKPQSGKLLIESDDFTIKPTEFTLKPNEVKTLSLELKLNPTPVDVARSGKVIMEVKNSAEDNIKLDNLRHFVFNPTELPLVFKQNDYTTEDDVFLRCALTDNSNMKVPSDLKFISGNAKELEQAAKDTPPELFIVQTPPNDIDATVNQIRSILDHRGNVAIIYQDSGNMRELLSRFGFETEQRSVKGTFRFEMINFDHPIFFPYRNLKISNWFEVLFFDVPKIKLPSGGQIVAAFNGGIPAIIDLRYRKGHIYLLASSLQKEHTNWPTFSTFLPFWRELAKISAQSVRSKYDFETTSGEMSGINGKIPLNSPGVYSLQQKENQPAKLYAVNHPAVESDLLIDCGEIPYKQLQTEKTTSANTGEITAKKVEDYEFPNTEILKYLILAALILLLAEEMLASRTAI